MGYMSRARALKNVCERSGTERGGPHWRRSLCWMEFWTDQKDTMTLETIHSSEAPAPIGPYSQAIAAGGFIFTAGQIGLAGDTMVDGGVAEQARQALRNLAAVLDAGGAGFADVVKTTIFLKDMGD